METITVRPHGEVQFRTFPVDGQTMLSVLIEDSIGDVQVDLEFRLSDFVFFANYAASTANTLVERRRTSVRRWWQFWRN